MNNVPILHLNQHARWFQMIGDPKTEEYRAITPYWSRIFRNGKIKIKGKFYHPSDVVVCFSNGYRTDRQQKLYRIDRLSVGFGRQEWGAEPDTQYFILHLGSPVIPRITPIKITASAHFKNGGRSETIQNDRF